MGQDPNQQYPGQYGQPGVPPQQEGYGAYQQPASGYQQPNPYQQPAPGYQQPTPGYQPPNTGYQYQQQTYGQPGMQYNTGNANGPTSMNMDPNTAAGLSYLTWIAGLIFLLSEKQNRFVRFHAMQEILLSVAWFIIGMVFSFIPFLGPIIWLAGFVLWLICIINAFQGKYFKLPLLGDLAERWANPGMPMM